MMESSTCRLNKTKNTENSAIFSKPGSKSCQIKFIPQSLEFENIDIHQKYEMTVVIKNQGKQNEKVRIIPPSSIYFTIKNQTNPFILAPGLSLKLTVFFQLKPLEDCSEDMYSDQITFVGSNFKKKVPLKATKPNFVLVMPKIFKVGLLRIGKQTKFSIPIQNIGKEDVQIRLMQASSPTICIEDPKIIVKKQSKSELHIKIKRTAPGLVEQFLYFPNGQSIELKGVCTEQKTEVYNKEGEILKKLNFGNIFIGEKISEPFYIANNSPSKIEGLVKVFDKNLVEFANLKVDLGKMAFVNRSNPKKTIQQENSVNFKCNKFKFAIEPFSDWENYLTILKQPTQEELKVFTTEAFLKIQPSVRESTWNTVVTVNQVLYIKIVNVEQPIKIPLQFNPIMPKISVSQNKFQFFDVQPKSVAKKSFSIRNCNQKPIKIKLENLGCFTFEGQSTILPLQTKQFQLCFRPLIPGDYSEHLKLTLFDTWVLYLKAYGLCIQSTESKQEKQNLKINKINFKNNLSISSSKSTRYLSQERKKRIECQKIRVLKHKLTQRVNLGFAKNADQPIDLDFDACENPKVVAKKNFTIQDSRSGLFFNKQEYVRTIAIKNRNLQNTSRLNVKEIVKFSEELTPSELQKIEIKCDRLDFGNVFVSSKTQKQLIIVNKNNKPILLELDLGNHEAISQTKIEPKKIGPFSEARMLIKLKPSHLGLLRIPLCYIINKQHIFQIDVVANVTLINLGFSTTQLDFSFAPNDINLEKSQNLTVTNYGTTVTKFVIVQPANKAFSIAGSKQQEVMPNSFTNVVIKYRPLEGSESGQLRVDSDKIIVKIIGGAENVIKCEGTVLQPKYSVKQTEVNFSQIFVSMVQQSKLTFRNNSKFQSVIKIQLYPSCLSEVISLDQKIFILTSQERKQISFTMMSHEVKLVKGHFIVSSRGGKTFKIPININFCFPIVQVVGMNEVDLGTVHIMTNHFEREISLINRTKTEIKLQSNRNESDKLDYAIEFQTAHQKISLAVRDTYNDSEKQDDDKIQLIKKPTHNDDKIVTANKIKNPKNILKTITLMPGVETKFKIKFVPKLVKQYDLKIPLYMHKATRDIDPIPQKIKCKAVEPLFYIKPYSISFNNVIISENKYAHKREFEVINPHDKEVDWQIESDNQEINNLFILQETSGKLKAKSSKKISVYYHPTKQGISTYKIMFFSQIDPEIGVELQVISNAVSPRINFNKNLLILPVVPIKTESKGTIDIENFGYEAVTISKAKFTQTFQGIDLKYTFLDGKLLSLAKTKLKVQISFKSDIPISFTTCLEIFDEYGDKISIPISATADNCILTTYPYLQMNNSTIVYDQSENLLKLLVSRTFCSKNKQTNISGSSAVTGNFIKKWCNYELNIQIHSFPDGFIQSKGQLLYEMIIKMTNGRPIVKKPCFTTQGKLSRILELHNYYSQVIKALQVQGAFLNHIRPEYLLNLSDYLLYMFHKEFIIEEEQFECISHDSWTVLFYQLCKLYVEPTVNQKFIQKFNYKHKIDKNFNSFIYSEHELLVLGFINEFLGEDKVYSMSDQAKLFEVIQRVLQKTFKISLGQELSKLKINADSLMLHEFLILVSKFLFSHLSQFGLSMYLEPNDLFTMGHKEFVLFFISLMQNLITFQSHSVVQFESASGQKNEKIIEIQNPSKKKKIKYWVRICGSTNFKANEKQIQIEPEYSRMLKITYHCKKNSSQQAQLILVPVKDEEYFTHAHSLNFLLKNILISKTVIKKLTMKAHLYDVKSINLDIELPLPSTSPQTCQYDVKLIGSQFIDELQYPNYYLIQPGLRTIKNGKDKCQIKIAALQLGQLSFKVILVSSSFQEYIYEFSVNVTQPNISHIFQLQPMISDKEQHRTIKIPLQNELKQQCIKFHREMNKQRQKNMKRTQPNTAYKIKNKTNRNHKYELEFMEESTFVLGSKTVDIGVKDKLDKGDSLNKVQIIAEFSRSYRQYKSLLLVKNQDLNDYRVYGLSTSVCIRPKIFNIKLSTKARQVAKSVISNKMTPFVYRLDKNVPELKIQQTQSGELILTFTPRWLFKEQVDLFVDNTQSLQQHIYKIKLESKLPEPIETVSILASKLFTTNFQVDLRRLHIKQKQLSAVRLRSDILRKHQISIKSEQGIAKIVGKIYPSEQEELSSLKLFMPKSDEYYEYTINIKNTPAIDLGILHLSENIGEVKKLIIPEIVTSSNDFIYEYTSDTYLTHQYVTSQANQLKKSNKNITNFCIVFKPTKEIQSEQNFKFKSNSRQYAAKVKLSAKKLETVSVPVIITENLDKKSTLIMIPNNLSAEGIYQCVVEDSDRFKADNQTIQMRGKDKIQLKINFIPKFIGDVCKTRLLLKSKTLPELTYYLEGISKFKCKQVKQEIQGFEGVAATKQLFFINQFNQKQRFKFQIVSSSKNYSFDSETYQFTRDINVGENIKFTVQNKCTIYNGGDEEQTKITVMRLSNRKIVKEYYLCLSLVKMLEGKKFNWFCKARETIFETIKLPNSYALKQIQTDPDILKYITLNIEEKNESEAKLKFSPLKPIKAKTFNILLISNKVKFRIECQVRVLPPSIDDIITIKTAEVKQTGITCFKLTNVVREPAPYRAYFEKSHQQLEVEPAQGVLEAYGKVGTSITIKFRSDIHNKRVEDKLIIETDNMYWLFKVVGMQEKILNF